MDTVTITNRLPVAVKLSATGHNAVTVPAAEAARPSVTPDVSADLWSAWLRVNRDCHAVRGEFVTAEAKTSEPDPEPAAEDHHEG